MMRQSPVLPVFAGSPVSFMREAGESLVERLEQERRWADAATVRSLLAHQQITLGLVDQARSEARRFSAEAHDLSLCADAIATIRGDLKRHRVPEATFIDDCAMNAVVQRNRIAMLTETLMATLARIDPMLEGHLGINANEIVVRARAELIRNGYDYPVPGPEDSTDHPADSQAA